MMEIMSTMGNSRNDENQMNQDNLIATDSACCWKMLLGTISPAIRSVGIMTMTASAGPFAKPKMEMKNAVATEVLVTTHSPVPLNVVERNQAGFSRSLRAARAEREPLLALCLTLFMSDDTRASSPPEYRPSRHMQEAIRIMERRLPVILLFSSLNPKA